MHGLVFRRQLNQWVLVILASLTNICIQCTGPEGQQCYWVTDRRMLAKTNARKYESDSYINNKMMFTTVQLLLQAFMF